MNQIELDQIMMQRALALAEKGMGWTSPNPMVGALVCHGSDIISEGYHPRVGEPHAERIAIDLAGDRARGATLYVTLEPCSHYGRTPPCLQRVLESGLSRVVIAMEDPNPKVNGYSIRTMKEAGLEVLTGVCEKDARLLNLPFISAMVRGVPWVTAKYAMTLDGKIATSTGSSQWVSGEQSRNYVQHLRQRNRAILVGYRTALVDNPHLNCRLEADPPPRQPLRVILGGEELLPSTHTLVQTSFEQPVLQIIQSGRGFRYPTSLPTGYEVLEIPANDEHRGISPHSILKLLMARDVDSLLIEGGGITLSSFMGAGCLDEIHVFMAPKILNEKDAISPFPGTHKGFLMSDATQLCDVDFEQLGDDIHIHGFIHQL